MLRSHDDNSRRLSAKCTLVCQLMADNNVKVAIDIHHKSPFWKCNLKPAVAEKLPRSRNIKGNSSENESNKSAWCGFEMREIYVTQWTDEIKQRFWKQDGNLESS